MKTHEEFEALLDAFVDGELSSEDMQAVQDHLNTCPDCRAYVDSALAIRAAFPTVEDTPVPEGFADGVMEAIQAQSAPQKKQSQPWKKLLLPLAACIAIVVVQTVHPTFTHTPVEDNRTRDAVPNLEYASESAEDNAAQPPEAAAEPTPAPDAVENETSSQPPEAAEVSPQSPKTESTEESSQPPDVSAASISPLRETEIDAAPSYFVQITLTAQDVGDALNDLQSTSETDEAIHYEMTADQYAALEAALTERHIVPVEKSAAKTTTSGLALVTVLK